MTHKTVFISRSVKENSVFRNLLSKEQFEIEDQSLVEFEKINIREKLPSCDWIFFYSKNAVKFFISQVDEKYLELVKFACMGKGTESKLLSCGFKSSFTGHGSPSTIANDFSILAENKKVLFPRALHSLKSIQNGIKPVCEVHDLPVYLNVPVSNPKSTDAKFVVFTSPMNAEVYLQNFKIKEDQILVAIGRSTSRKLLYLAKQKVYVSPSPEEDKLARFVIDIYKGLTK